MTEHDVQRFLQALDTDAKLHQKVSDLNPDNEGEAASALVGIGSEHGYAFTAEELQAYVRANAPQAGELGDEELEHVAGGVLIGLLLPAVQKVRDGSSDSSCILFFLGGLPAVQKVRDGTSNTLGIKSVGVLPNRLNTL